MGVGVGQFLRQAALRWAGRTGVVDLQPDGRRTYGYEALAAGAARVAAALAARGIGPGSRVALCAANSAEFVQAWFGAIDAGATVVPLPILSSAWEVRERLSLAACRALLVDGPRQDLAAVATGVRVFAIEELVAGPDGGRGPVDVGPGAPAMLLFTSGTTGRPRAALVSHASLVAHTAALVHHTLRLGEGDCVLGVLPLTHSFGCRMVMLAALYSGAPMVLMPRFDAGESLRAAEDERVTWLPAVPTMFAAWARAGRALQSDRLRWCLSAGAPLPGELALRAEGCLGVEVRQGYGMTEATFSTVNAPPDRRVPNCVGRPVWGVEVRVARADGGAAREGETGEVLVRGTNLMTGYDGAPEATAAVLRGGWMHSGDLGWRDGEGRLYVVDRLKDLIVRGGFKVAPSEIEDALAAHPSVAEAVAVGRPDAYYGEEIVAVVVARAGGVDAGELVAWSRERLGPAKYPREFAFVERLPTGPSGKVLRRELRRMVAYRELATVRPGGAGPGANALR